MFKLWLCILISTAWCSYSVADSSDMTEFPEHQEIPLTLLGDFNYYGLCYGGNNCYYSLGFDGSPASGSGNFNANSFGTLQVSYSFETAPALYWQDNGDSYVATFGLGGYFDITLPNGLIFTGLVTSGTAGGGPGLMSQVLVDFVGQWSNGQYATGSLDEHEFGFGPVESLSEQVTDENNSPGQSTPEPSSFLLLGTAVTGAWSWKKALKR